MVVNLYFSAVLRTSMALIISSFSTAQEQNRSLPLMNILGNKRMTGLLVFL
jgi:hypothetical protein